MLICLDGINHNLIILSRLVVWCLITIFQVASKQFERYLKRIITKFSVSYTDKRVLTIPSRAKTELLRKIFPLAKLQTFYFTISLFKIN